MPPRFHLRLNILAFVSRFVTGKKKAILERWRLREITIIFSSWCLLRFGGREVVLALRFADNAFTESYISTIGVNFRFERKEARWIVSNLVGKTITHAVSLLHIR